MTSHVDKEQGNQVRASAISDSQKKSAKAATFQLVDKRPESLLQKKLQNLANNSPQSKKIAQLQALTRSTANNQPVVQLVLRNNTPQNRALEARLIREYHAAEASGDAISVVRGTIADQRRAKNFYTSARSKRRRAGRLHVNQDGGHLQAIATLTTKINARNARIRALEQAANSGRRARRPALNRG